MRPITLLNSIYKIMDKLVTKRLQKEIEDKKIIKDTQAGFMPRRNCSN